MVRKVINPLGVLEGVLFLLANGLIHSLIHIISIHVNLDKLDTIMVWRCNVCSFKVCK